jgi:hypothetical protein
VSSRPILITGKLIMKKNLRVPGSNGFEQREIVGKHGYWEDPRWKTVTQLRRLGKNSKANGLVSEIRESWGVD